jgi:AhpD family alkylhydroperoxidase
MPSPLAQVTWDPCLLTASRDRRVEAWLKREAGSAPGWSRYYWSLPWLAKAAIRLNVDPPMVRRLEPNLAHLVALVVSQENSCRYCYAVARAMMRMLGTSEARMQDLEQRLAAADIDEKTAAAVRFARVVNRGNPLAGEDERAALRAAGFADEEIRELAYVIAVMGFINRMSTAPALPPQTWEALPDNPAVRLLRPLVARVLMRGHGAAPPPAGNACGSVLAPALIDAYAGSPIGRVLAGSLNDLWAAEGLERRAKVLMLATVAQGIECDTCQREAAALAFAEGIDPTAFHAIITHLDSRHLDERERALIEFARESLWYEPVKLQRLSRELHAALGEHRFLEALAVVAFANAIGRMTAATVS